MTKKKIAIIGSTGNVGRKIVELIINRKDLDPALLNLFASSRSAGKQLQFGPLSFTVQDTDQCRFEDHSIVLFATESDVSRKYVPQALKAQCRVVDSSSAYRLKPDVPLVVVPVNGHLISSKTSLYAAPNCVASPIALVLKPLHEHWGVKRVVASTYQSTSGAGKDPMDELYRLTQSHLNGEKVPSQYFPRPIAFNVIPQVDRFLEDGYSYEEYKIINEVQKIVSPEIKLTVTSVRVPVGIGHSISLSIELHKKADIEEITELLKSSPGIGLSSNHYMTPIEAEGTDLVHVGRLRKDPSVENGIALWAVSDNLRRGAALDAVEIAEKLLLNL